MVQVCLSTEGTPATDTIIDVTLIPGTAGEDGEKLCVCVLLFAVYHTIYIGYQFQTTLKRCSIWHSETKYVGHIHPSLMKSIEVLNPRRGFILRAHKIYTCTRIHIYTHTRTHYIHACSHVTYVRVTERYTEITCATK